MAKRKSTQLSKRTRVVATLGPASHSEAMLRRLIRAGVDVVRLNFSHGSHEFHKNSIETVRRVSAELGEPVAILQDLSGPKMRVGRIEEDRIRLRSGERIEMIEGSGVGNLERLYVEVAGSIRRLGKGQVIRLADGLLELRVESRRGNVATCKIIRGGYLRSRQGVNIPGADLGVSPLTRKDRKDLAFGLSLGVDAVALSFVRSKKDIVALRKVIASKVGDGPTPLVIAKIERAEALEDLDGILDVSSGVMVARGDLGVEIGVEKVPLAQKRIIRMAIAHNKPVITATQMLESMIDRPTPTRAEVSDVANAVFEGTDALMLSGETAVGLHPVEAVKTLVSVSREVEKELKNRPPRDDADTVVGDVAKAISRGSREVARTVNARAVLGFTASGRTVRLISSWRPGRSIYGFTHLEATVRRMKFFWGVTPVLMRPAASVDGMIAEAELWLVSNGKLKRGDKLVVVCGQRLGTGSTNSIHVHTVGD
ncbi:MAG: pyruvate kinase [Pseudohongiellaceae bacterium]|jgi:pyruvate kinase